MKNIFNKIRRVFTNRYFLAGVVVFAIVVGGAWWYASYSEKQFIEVYDTYEQVSQVQQNAAYVPGATANPVRDQLNTVLGQVLGSATPAKARLALSAEGLDLLQQLNKQVDAINDTAQPVADAIVKVKAVANSPGNILHHGAMTDLVAKAKVQMDTIQTIRGLSYKANFETIQIFNRIIADKGVLTSQYTSELNNDIPVVEGEFNNRQNAYTDLETNINDMQNGFDGLVASN